MSDTVDEWSRSKKSKNRSNVDIQKQQISHINARARTASFRQSGKKQAVFRVSGYLSSVAKSSDHLSYISRNNDNEVEDEQGNIYTEREEINDLIDEWSVDFTAVKKGQDKDRVSLILDSNSEAVRDENYQVLKELGKKYLSDHDIRVDKSRSVSQPNRVYLRATIDPKDRESFDTSFKNLIDNEISGTPHKVEERKTKLPRNAMKVILSTPTGTKPEAAHEAARQFSSEEFGNLNHRYMMSLHTDTDNPHVHLVVKMLSENGVRLDTSKSQLKHWKDRFAHHCRDQGIEVESSYRSERGVGTKGVNNSVYFMNKENRDNHYQNNQQKRKDNAYKSGEYVISGKEIAQLRRNIKEREGFVQEARYLRKFASSISDKEKQRKLIKTAAILEKEAKSMPMPKSSDRVEVDKMAKDKGTKIKQVMPDAVKNEVRANLERISKSLSNEEKSPSKTATSRRSRNLDQDNEMGR